MRHRAALAATIAALASAALPGAAGAAVLPAGTPDEVLDTGSHVLSDERELTRWITPFNAAPIRSRPAGSARSVSKLRFRTEDGLPEVYPVLRSRAVGGRVWFQVRVPGRPNGRKGWVRREDVGPLNLVRTYMRIERKALRATLFRRGKKIWSSRIGIGKPSTPTPAGRFWIRERLRGLGGIYGPWAFGTGAYAPGLTDWPGGGVIGIHGTNQPQLIPGRPSNGCIRVPNDKIRKLARLMPVGTPVRII